ncbi:MAG: DNA-binding protein [Planctomycetales bacterium]|nr:DNA-binding protein [Planctomycetales bacterium]
MDDELLTVAEAARRLALRTTTLYDWLGRSDYGLLEIRGQQIRVDYLQTGPRGQGRIRIPAGEVRKLLDAMRVRPCAVPAHRIVPQPKNFPGITVPLGRPDR